MAKYLVMSNLSASIIIPVLNQSRKLEECLSELRDQLYNSNNIEVIVIDNGSTDGSEKLAEKYDFRSLNCASKNSPYQARNMGADESNGDVLVFLDAKCKPSKNYIFEIEKMLSENDWDLVAGDFYFTDLSSKSSLSELAYASMFLRSNPKYNGGEVSTLTGNMMVKKKVFLNLGKFDVTRSGGDVKFSQKAELEKKIKIFNSNLRVSYQSKMFEDLIKFIKRDAKGPSAIKPWYSVRPANISYINERLDDLNINISFIKKIKLMFFIMYLRFIKFYNQSK